MKAAMSAEAEAVQRVKEAGRVLGETLDMRGRIERNPYGMVAAALGIGFVLGGGLFTRLTAGILGTGLRIGLMAALPSLQEKLFQAVSSSKLDINNKESKQ